VTQRWWLLTLHACGRSIPFVDHAIFVRLAICLEILDEPLLAPQLVALLKVTFFRDLKKLVQNNTHSKIHNKDQYFTDSQQSFYSWY
jgi:hypothetical protein